MRILGPTLATLCLLAPATAFSQPLVHLDRPGAREAIQREDPQLFRRIEGLIEAASVMPCQDKQLGRAMATFDAKEAACGVMLLTSYPSKRHFSFVIGQTRYITHITMKDMGFGLRKAS